MGDRANVIFRTSDGDDRVWLYMHNGGSCLPERLRLAVMESKPRWNDPPYMTRMIICRLIPKDLVHDQYGYGISTSIGDNEYPIFEVDCIENRVRLWEFDCHEWCEDRTLPPIIDMAFEEFCDEERSWDLVEENKQ